MTRHELKYLDGNTNVGEEQPQSRLCDDFQLQRLGKKPVLKRTFGILPLLGFSCTVLSTWEAVIGSFKIPLQNGGPAGAVYSFIFAWIGTGCCFVVLSELASMAPTSGGQYHWCAMLAPMKWMKVLSYITGWLSTIGWQASFATSVYMGSTVLQGVITLSRESYHPKLWQGTLIAWAKALFYLSLNLIGGKLLSRLESFVLVFHILGFFAILIPLVYMSEHQPADQVFLRFINTGHFSNNALSSFVGMTGCAFAFSGGDSTVHMAEEALNAAVAIPRAIVMSTMINGVLGFGMLLTLLFCMGNIDDVLKSKTDYPFLEIFHQVTGSVGGTIGMYSVMLCCGFASAVGALAATSRQFWSFSRDRAVPGLWIWSRVSTRGLPTNSIILTVAIACLLASIGIGSPVTLDIVLSLSVSGVYGSYIPVLVLLLYRRCKGHILPYSHNSNVPINVPGARLAWGPFRVPGIWGILVNSWAVLYTLIIIFFSFWPDQMHPSLASMNWSVVVFCGTCISALIYYGLRARHVYQGPVFELR